ncbi:CDP-diacylglycerol--glycerol-3-phosphate 3-phosphatidyltransferase [Clostridia bacterium]|nr:CDP-diacylglycerol--glycerol-3-phosphate 3-phosphatidyltransferase [Clostridia bacterium]
MKLNIPNTLSLARLALVPVFVLVFFVFDTTAGHWWAAGIYVVATATDALDGMLARRWNQITRLGRVLDPAADKLMSFAVLICIAIDQPLLGWAVIIFFVKEALMAIGALVQFKRIDDVPPSKLIGKFSTVFFFLTCLSIMTIPVMPLWCEEMLVGIAIALTLIAFGTYLARYLNLTKKQ